MESRDLLRQYLEQRRELGESEFVLDSMTVEDAMKMIGAGRAGGAGPSAPRTVAPSQQRDSQSRASSPGPLVPPTPRVREVPPGQSDDWRATLRAAGAAPATAKGEQPTPPPVVQSDIPSDVSPDAPIVVGSSARELFGGALSHVGSLDEIAKLIAACRGCALHATALNPVPGEGNPSAKFVCVGEAPGQTEDETGRPFVGRAGDLLTKILAAVDLKREDVFICNVLKHRPPGNRNPAPDEIVACRPFLMRQLELLQPKVILALGTFAAQTLLESKLSIGKLRGKVHTFYGIPLVVTYHPAALLRNPAWKRPTWEDVQSARRLLDRPNGPA